MMVRRETIREYATGSLWVLPGISAVLALGIAGTHLHALHAGGGSMLNQS